MGKSLTFGRWEKAAGDENARTGPTEGPGPIAHLRKVSRNTRNQPTFGRWEETIGSMKTAHLQKVGKNAGNHPPFGRREEAVGNGNADTGTTEDFRQLRTFGR